MCDVCVMEAVKGRMLSRRSFFQGSAVAAVGAAGLATTTPAMAAGHGSVVDMTHMMDETFPTYFGAPGIAYDKTFDFAESGFNLYNLTVNEHTGTHIDAPLHFSADGQSVDEIPVENLVCPLAVIDIAGKAEADPDAQVTPEDLSTWIAANGPIPDGACVAMHSGWAAKVRGSGYRGVDGEGVQHFPGFHVEAAQMLMEETGAVAMAVDTLSRDHGLTRWRCWRAVAKGAPVRCLGAGSLRWLRATGGPRCGAAGCTGAWRGGSGRRTSAMPRFAVAPVTA